MPQQEVDVVLDAIATRLAAFVTGIDASRVDAFQPASLRMLPRIVLRYLDSPWKLSSSRNQINHTIQIEAIVAPLSDAIRARREASRLIRDIKHALFLQGAKLDLIAPPNQTTVGPEGSQAIRNVIYENNPYHAAIIIIRAVEVTGEEF